MWRLFDDEEGMKGSNLIVNEPHSILLPIIDFNQVHAALQFSVLTTMVRIINFRIHHATWHLAPRQNFNQNHQAGIPEYICWCRGPTKFLNRKLKTMPEIRLQSAWELIAKHKPLEKKHAKPCEKSKKKLQIENVSGGLHGRSLGKPSS